MMSVIERNPAGADGVSARFEAVTAFIDEARQITRDFGVGDAALDRIGQRLVALGRRTELFPREHFPVEPGSLGSVYRLAEDADGRFALFACAGVPGEFTRPRQLATWAVMAGVCGQAHLVIYRRLEDDPPGVGRLQRLREVTAAQGRAVTLSSDEVHSIAIVAPEPGLHLHLYGLAVDRVSDGVRFESPDGGAYQPAAAPALIRAPAIAPSELKAAIRDGEELAILDVRDEGRFAEKHLLFAACAPLSRLELVIDRLVPRRTTRIVLTDAAEALVHDAAKKLTTFGYRHVCVLRGGVGAWEKAGYELFSGVHVPSKAFGEIVEHELGTPRLPAAAVKRLQDQRVDLVILDSRPFDEYHAMNIPAGVDCPGGELVHRAGEVVRSPDTLVVVNCAGRTRSIIGAQSLINAGLPNRVVALENGTMGWQLAGFALEHGQSRVAPFPGRSARAQAKEAAARVAACVGVESISLATLVQFRAEQNSRTLYVFDVRTPDEYAAGHLVGSRSAPGGQLVQATDAYAATLNARIVLVDDDGVRATMTASWLIQLGWPDVYVLADGLTGDLEIGPEPMSIPGLGEVRVPLIDAAALKSLIDENRAFVIDVENSLAFRARHIPGAWFTTRGRTAQALARAPADAVIVVTSQDGVLAKLAAAEIAATVGRDVSALVGGTGAWLAAGLRTESGAERLLVADDVWYRPSERDGEREASMRDYLTWETNLVEQIARDGDAQFRVVPCDLESSGGTAAKP
jgi:rhodanese-related sulfurtransferase/predicted metal-dependent enzyme (double-stranded beta helix superfamily)